MTLVIGMTLFAYTSEASADVNYFLYNAPNRSVVQLVNTTSTVNNKYEYDAFGNIKTSTENTANVYKYVGEQLEKESSLIFLRNRYYDSSAGRFITKDLFRGSTQDPRTINPYPYCSNNPVNHIDPQGLLGFEDLIFGGVGAVAGVVGQIAGDLLSGNPITPANVIGAAIGGAVGGETLLYTMNPVLAGAAGGAAGSSSKQWLGAAFDPNHSLDNLNFGKAAFDTVAGGALGWVGGNATSAFAGRGGFESITNQIVTKLSLGEIGGFSFQTGLKMTAYNAEQSFLGIGFDLAKGGVEKGAGSFGLIGSFDPIFSFGGVSLSKTAQLMINVQDVGGATFDPLTGQVILYGKQNVALPNMDLDDLSVAVASEYGLTKSPQDPGVSIGTETSDVQGQMKVRYDGATINTRFGSVMFNSDRLLKTLIMGKDNITGNPVTSSVAGYQNMLTRYQQAQYLPPNGSTTRMWFVPLQISLIQSPDGSAMEFSTTTMQVLTESKYLNNVTADSYAEAFASHLTQNYDAFANESPVLKDLKRLGEITAIVKWIKDNNIPFDLSFFSNYTPAFVSTPSYTPQTTVSTSWTSGNTIYTLTITGGVVYKLDASNFSTSVNSLATTAAQAATSTRPSDTNFTWNFSAQDGNGQTQAFTAIAQSFVRSQKDGSVRGEKTDMSFPVVGDNPLALVRYYNSFYDKASGFGYGWQNTPYGLRFPDAARTFTFGNQAISVSAHYQIYVRKGENEYLYTLLGLDTDGKPLYMRDGGNDALKDNMDGTFRLNRRSKWMVFFGSQGQVTSVVDRNGIAINYNYNPSLQLTSIVHQNGRTITVNYTGNTITSAVGPDPRTVTYTYYPNGQLNTVVDAANQTTTYFYDADLHITKINDPRSNASYQAVYDDYNRATSQTLGAAAQYSKTFNLYDRMTTTTDPNGAATTQMFDADYRLIQNQDFLNNTTNITYDPSDFGPSSVTNPNGELSTYQYDFVGNLSSIKDINGGTKLFFYDINFDLVATRNELGYDTVYVYDGNHKVTEIRYLAVIDYPPSVPTTDPIILVSYSYDPAYVIDFTYDSNGNLLSTTDAEGRTVNTTYDVNGMPLVTSFASTYKVTKTYDAFSRLSSVSDPAGDNASFAYDNVDRITGITTAAGGTSYIYDGNGNLTTVTDARNYATNFAYDANNNLTTVTDALNDPTNYTYDTTNKLTAITMPNGAIKQITYDEANRPIMEISTKPAPAPRIAVVASTINFGSVPAGTPVTQQLMVYNAGDAALNITNVSSSNSVFTVSPQTATIAGGGQSAFTITMTSPAIGTSTGNLTIQSNDTKSPSIIVSLTGTAILPVVNTNVSSQLNGLFVQWSKYQGTGTFDHYSIYRSTSTITSLSGLTPITTIPNISTLSYLDPGDPNGAIVIGSAYYYAVAAFDTSGNLLTTMQSFGPVNFFNLGSIGNVINLAAPPNNENNIAEVYNSTAGEYLVVYQNDVSSNGTNIDIYAQRISSTGQKIGNAFQIFNSSYSETKPQVAWNSSTNEYMIVCEYNSNGAGLTQVRAQRVSATGSLVGSPITIYPTTKPQKAPSIVYNLIQNRYLVAFAVDLNNDGIDDLLDLVLDSSGNWLSGQGNTYNYNIENPKIAFNSQVNSYFIVTDFTDNANYVKIAIFQVNNTGAVTGAGVPPFTQKVSSPQILYNPPRNEYIITAQYDYLGNGNQYAALLVQLDAAGDILAAPYSAISGYSCLWPNSVYFSTKGEYFVTYTFSDPNTGESDIRTFRFSENPVASLSSVTTAISSLDSQNKRKSAAAFNGNNEFLVSYEYYNGSNFDIRTQRVGAITNNLSVSPVSLNFGINTTSQTLQVNMISGENSMSLSNSADASWLSVSPGNISIPSPAPSTYPSTVLTITVNKNGLPAGTYSGNVFIQCEGITQTIPVTIQVTYLPPNAPSSPTPVNGATSQAIVGTPLRVAMTWTGSDPQGNPLTYDVYLGTNQTLVTNMDPSVLVSQGQTAASFTSGALNYNTKYYWKVNAKDNFALSTSSSVWNFTTIAIPAPVLIAHSPNPDNTTKPLLTWNAVAGVASYHVQVSSSSTFSPLLVDATGVATTSYTPSVALPAGAIYWRVAAVDTLGNQGAYSASDSFVIQINPPAQVTLIPYTPNPTNIQKPTLTWNSVANANLYHVQISTVSNFSSLLVDSFVPTTSYTPTTNLPQGVIYWRVSAKDLAGNEGVFSNTSNFTINITPPLPVQLASLDGGFLNIKVNWNAFNDTYNDFSHFNIYRSSSAITNVSGMVPMDQSITNKLTTQFVDSTAVSGQSYYYTVTATDTAGNEYKLVTSLGPVSLASAPTLNTTPTITNHNPFALSGTKSAGTSIWVNGVQVYPWGADLTWQANVTLTEGANTLTVLAKDSSGNQSISITRNIQLKTIPPHIAITSPANNSGVSATTVDVSGTIDDPQATITVKVNGSANTISATNKGDGTFLASAVPINSSGQMNVIAATATDLAGNTATSSVSVLQGWVLHLTVPYSAMASDGSGAATAVMISNYIRNGLKDNLTQDQIYNYGHPYNLSANSTLAEMDSHAVEFALGHFDPYDTSDPTGEGDPYAAYNFSTDVFDSSHSTDYLRDIIHWMAYPVTIGNWWLNGPLVQWPNTPDAVPAYGTYNHWVVVNGAAADQDPIPQPHTNPWYTPNFTAYGLWITDPATGGIGQDMYVTAQTAQNTFLLALTSNDQYNGQFVLVAEPPEVLSTAQVKIAPAKVNEETLKLIQIFKQLEENIPDNLSNTQNRLEAARKHLYDAAFVVNLQKNAPSAGNNALSAYDDNALDVMFNRSLSPLTLDWKKLVDASVLTDENFLQAFDGSQARGFIKVRRLDQKDSFYYLIPFDKFVKGQFLTYTAIIINAQDGSFQQASWVKDPARFVQVTRDQALELVFAQEPALQNAKVAIELVWQPNGYSSSPFYPYWKVTGGGKTYFVTQNQEVTEKDETNK
ncbi:MAG: choice-of-anchor D domain-containing protein [Candidatus Omnitrophica bacterium]|nr:choice-of-anchor D domain-containing protein [Candidatus Omnitrophota bacterium]